MKILMVSHVFHPSIGGIESVSRTLAEGFVAAGHEVTVVTQTTSSGDKTTYSFSVLRRPNTRTLWKEILSHDVFFQNNISLRSLPLGLLSGKPCIVSYHIWLNHGSRVVGAIKHIASRFVTRLAISQAVAGTLPSPVAVIGNPYDDTVFRRDPSVARDKDLIFVGRLVSDKGVDLLLEAIVILKQQDLRPLLTIVGDGEERQVLEAFVHQHQLESQVVFLGTRSPDQVANLLNQHRILVVPSRWAEPFGVIALEAIACGCVVVGSESGGLPEAIGPCGKTFPNGSSSSLAEVLAMFLTNISQLETFDGLDKCHLERFQKDAIVKRYLSKIVPK